MIIGLDVGGTHTDAVLLADDGLRAAVKVPTDANDLFHSVLSGLEQAVRGQDPARIRRIVLSTTLTTNAIVQSRIGPVGMIVSGGPGIDPELFRLGDHYVCVSGAVDHRGRETEPVDEAQIRAAGQRFRRDGVRHVGVVGKFSVRNPSHENRIGRILADDFEQVFLGHHCAGLLNFPRRIATTYLNAAVYPLYRDFFLAVKQSLERMGFTVPIRILKADGGNIQFDASLDAPVQTILSGPAASVMGATVFAPPDADCLVLDIGGTTTDMALLVKRIPLLNPLGIEIAGIKTLVRSMEVHSIGIGGDSTVRIRDGRIVVGPERSGPAMGYGGAHFTPTDALMILGRIEDGSPSRAREGAQPLAAMLGVTVEEAAKAVFVETCRGILDEAAAFIERIRQKPVYTVHEMLDGATLSPRRILILGGPAEHFAGGLSSLSGWDVEVVPRSPVANAIGAALARTTSQVTLFADTELGMASAPEEQFHTGIDGGFSLADALSLARQLLCKRAVSWGANADTLEMDTVEALEFNMVRGFRTAGKNIRVTVQVTPGLIRGYEQRIR